MSERDDFEIKKNVEAWQRARKRVFKARAQCATIERMLANANRELEEIDMTFRSIDKWFAEKRIFIKESAGGVTWDRMPDPIQPAPSI